MPSRARHFSSKKSATDFDLYPLYLIGLTTYVGPGTVGAYLTLTIKSIGFSTFHTNLLVIPFNVLFLANNFLLTYTSKKTGHRALVGVFGSVWQLIFLVAIVTLPHSANHWLRYALLSLYLAYPYAHPILVSWNSANSGSVRTRSVSASLYNISVQIGSIISSQIYHPSDAASYYAKGNRVLLYILAANFASWGFAKAWLVYRNAYKARKWDALTPEEKEDYLSTTTDEGNRRLDFRFVH